MVLEVNPTRHGLIHQQPAFDGRATMREVRLSAEEVAAIIQLHKKYGWELSPEFQAAYMPSKS